MFDFIDDVATGTKRLIAMGRTNADPDRNFAKRQIADPMDAARVGDTKLHAGFFDDPVTLSNRERLEGFVFEVTHFATFVEIADPAFERGITTAGGVLERAS